MRKVNTSRLRDLVNLLSQYDQEDRVSRVKITIEDDDCLIHIEGDKVSSESLR